MKMLQFKIACLLFFLPVLVIAKNPDWKGKYTKEKKINKVFPVNNDALLKIENSYGNLYITSWNENKIVIEVSIKTNGDDEEKVLKKLDEINVDFSASSSQVSAETIFNESRNWNWSWGKRCNVNMEINYTIKLPVTNSIKLDNDYGSINIDRIDGKAIISCDYGKLNINELNADGNQLSFDYTNNSTIGFIKSGSISADYSGYEIERAGDIEISADYTSSKIINAENIRYSCDYGSIKIENVDNVEGNGDYLTTRFGVVNGSVRLTSDFGSIKIEKLSTTAKDIEIESDYTGIKIGYDENYHFDFTLNLEYAGLKTDKNFDFRIKREGVTDKYYEGFYGSREKNKIAINSDYGSISFYKN